MLHNNEKEALRIFRQLTPKYQADLLGWVHLAYVAENFARKSVGLRGMPHFKNTGVSCRNKTLRSKKK